ncbi:MAG: RidA family protein [Gammaproteobacteria bacterium]
MEWNLTFHPTYWAGKKLVYPDVPAAHPKFAQSIVVGNLVIVSGCVGQDVVTMAATPKGIEEQVWLSLTNTKTAMETAGSSMGNIIKTFFLITSLDDYQAVRKTETEFYEAHAPELITNPPAATLMVIPSLARPEFRCEYEVIGVVDRSRSDCPVTYYPEYWGGTELAYPHVPKEHAKFARSQVADGLVILSGCQALDHDSVRTETDDVGEQSRIVLDKLRVGMEETGGSLETMVKTNVFVKSSDDLATYRKVEKAYFDEFAPSLAETPPASTGFIVDELPRPEFLVEVEASGVAGSSLAGWPVRFYPGTEIAAAGASAGRLLFLSGIDGTDPDSGRIETDDIEQQLLIAMEKARITLEAAGSSMNNVIKTLMMLKRLEDYSVMRKTEFDFCQQHAPTLVTRPPASTFMKLPEISVPGSLFQIDITAVL